MTKIVYIASKCDIAAMNIANFLSTDLPILFIDNDSIFTDISLEADLIVYLSRHKAKSHIPSLTVHSIGNFGQAEFGGRNKTLVPTNALAIKQGLCILQVTAEEMKLTSEYQVTVEVTHHGPFNTSPTIFLEVGSSETEWKNPKPCECVARTIKLLSKFHERKEIPAIAFGGPHYSDKFTKLLLGSNYAIGHICPRYALENLDSSLIKQMIDKTLPSPKVAIFDRKGSTRKTELTKLVADYGLEVEFV